MTPSPRREIVVADALEWLAVNTIPGSSLVTSLPDRSEFPGRSLDEWQGWFRSAARAVLSATPATGVTVFFQTDIRVDGQWVDKAFLCQSAAEALGIPLLWHKIACRARPGQATFGRPGYAHLLCFSRSVQVPIPTSTADVLPELGAKTWEPGLGFGVCRLIADFIRSSTPSTTVVNPFCGEGAMVAVANAAGLDALGIERSVRRAAKARALTADLASGTFGEAAS